MATRRAGMASEELQRYLRDCSDVVRGALAETREPCSIGIIVVASASGQLECGWFGMKKMR